MKQDMIEQVTKIIAEVALRVDIERQEIPTPQELATAIVEYFYKEAAKTEEEVREPSEEDANRVRGIVEGDN